MYSQYQFILPQTNTGSYLFVIVNQYRYFSSVAKLKINLTLDYNFLNLQPHRIYTCVDQR